MELRTGRNVSALRHNRGMKLAGVQRCREGCWKCLVCQHGCRCAGWAGSVPHEHYAVHGHPDGRSMRVNVGHKPTLTVGHCRTTVQRRASDVPYPIGGPDAWG
jgi:hypothetical protein